MEDDSSRDGIFQRNFGHGHFESQDAAKRRSSLSQLEDGCHAMFDIPGEDEYFEPTTPSGSSAAATHPSLTFGSLSMQYFNKKLMHHDHEDMDAEHTDKIYHLELVAPDLTEHELSRSFDQKVYQKHFQPQDSSKELSDVARVASNLAHNLITTEETQSAQSPSGSTRPLSIPMPNPAGQYQNSKILSAFYSQTGGVQGQSNKENSLFSNMASSPVSERAMSLSPQGSPNLERKGRSNVKNREVNVWAPGSM